MQPTMMKQHEIRGLAQRLEARADSKIRTDEPEQAKDLRLAARILNAAAGTVQVSIA